MAFSMSKTSMAKLTHTRFCLIVVFSSAFRTILITFSLINWS